MNTRFLKVILLSIATSAILNTFAGDPKSATVPQFDYIGERFADIEILRYKVEGFDDLTLKQKN